MSHFLATTTAIISLAVDALTSAPHLTLAEKKSRTEAIASAIMAFLPTEPVQTMLASQAVCHHFTLMDTFQEINVRALSEKESTRMRMVTATQTRMIFALVKEIRIVRKEALAMAEAEQTARQPAGATAGQPSKSAPAGTKPTMRDPNDDAAFEANARAFEDAVKASAAKLNAALAQDKSVAAHQLGSNLQNASDPRKNPFRSGMYGSAAIPHHAPQQARAKASTS